MEIVVVGAGPTGLTAGAVLARRGHRVVVVDRDPGPASDGSWRRRGVMQFEHPHGFRHQVVDLLSAEWPEAWVCWRALGAVPIRLPLPGVDTSVEIVGSRRSIYERALRAAAADVPGLSVEHGHVDALVDRNGRVAGAVIDGSEHPADLVVDAAGRLSQLPTREAATVSGDTGIAYVTRNYRRHRSAGPGPSTRPGAWVGIFDGYQVYVFVHDQGHFSVVIIRPTADADLSVLRHRDAFDTACRAIPGLDEWTDPALAVPTSEVLTGVRLRNVYRPPLDRRGLVAIGDAVATTAPTAGRGVAMASMQIRALLELLDAGADPVTIARPFRAWCDAWIRPWVQDHVAVDAEAVQRWQGVDIDPDQPLTSAAIVAAAQADERIVPHIAPYLAMTALPASLAPAEPLARAVYTAGWRPAWSDGPSRDELVGLLHRLHAPAFVTTGTERRLSA
jgi:2-polyprenyl-6-methoxyphenol hydroxylase-like FAD-dependent oxidoreductase